MTEELAIHEIRIDMAAGCGDSYSQMTSFDVIMPPKLESIMKAHIVSCVALSRLVIHENE